MLKLANQVLDAYDDVTKAGLKKLAAINPNIRVMSFEEKAALGDKDFALSVITKTASKINKFPINDYDNTWLSNEYFDMTSQRLTKEASSIAASHIKKACEVFNITPKPSVSSMAKEASTNVYYEGSEVLRKNANVIGHGMDKFAEASKIGDNYTHAQYVMATPTEVKIACAYFEKNASKMPVEARHKYAAAIQRRSNELGMGAQKGFVSKYASDHYSPQVDAHILSRKTLLQDIKPEMAANFSKLGAAKKQLSPSQFAKALYQLDKKAGIQKYYGGSLTDPFLASFAAEPDQYEGYRVKVGSMQLNSDEIASLANGKYDQIKNYFGSTIAEELKKNPVPIFDSLPMDSKEILAGIANGSL